MRFLIDANLPRRLTAWLAERGHHCEHVLDLGLGQSSDSDLWTLCGQTGATILTKDQDFADRVRATPMGPAVIWLRTGNGTTADLIALLTPLISTIEARLSAGDRLVELRRL